jgi:ATP-dependent Clp protease ATP-binding subunit ClpA
MFARSEQPLFAMDPVFLNPDEKSSRAREFEERLASRVVGQERAVRGMSSLYQK